MTLLECKNQIAESYSYYSWHDLQSKASPAECYWHLEQAAELYARSKSEQIWKTILNYENYEISSFGHVRNNKQYVTVSRNNNGYFRVSLYKNSQSESLFIHHLVAEYFIGPRPNGCVVMHIDNNRMNNHVSNLRYGTQSENINQAINEGRKPSVPSTRKTPKQLEEVIIQHRKSGLKLKEICDLTGVPIRTLQKILSRNNTYKPEFKI